ncbi:hypothetical protein IIA15_10730, partial [candidate division TA06 bacterium]|nr:hypothetical protein [candidate division TA06 bacterium]
MKMLSGFPILFTSLIIFNGALGETRSPSQPDPVPVWNQSALEIDPSTRDIEPQLRIKEGSSLIKILGFYQDSPDVRLRPTTNTTQSEMSIAVSPLNSQLLLASANATNFPFTTIFGTGFYVSTDGGLTWTGQDDPGSGLRNKGDPAA